ncbi:MAG: zf-HC2 domain-containing protein [Acidobacteria bacterium]|nr:zf-HC2 domain-containing protein [Acidobacteriota bacterium]
MGVVARERAECPRTSLTAAYLDGELDPAACEEFESHTPACPDCSAALLEQRRLLCLLDTAFDETFEKKIELPKGFTRELTARAQNDLRGVRDARERKRALKICAALSAAAFALLGFAALDVVVRPALRALGAATGALGVAGRASADAGSGAAVVLRAVAGRLLPEAESAALFWGLLLVGGVLLLLRLVSGYHRASARD